VGSWELGGWPPVLNRPFWKKLTFGRTVKEGSEASAIWEQREQTPCPQA
jgi:hypothetical protein